MVKLNKTLIRALHAVAISFVGFSMAANAITTEEEAANEEVVKRILEVKGTPGYQAVAPEVFTEGHKKLRREFENLFYHAEGDPVLQEASDPDYVAITERVNTIERLIGDGDLVAAQIRVQGKHTGNLYGIAATGKTFEVMSNAVFRMEDGKIAESWWMLQEGGVLMDLGVGLPKRADGGVNLAPAYDDTRTFDEDLAAHQANYAGTDEWHNKTLLLAYKSQAENRPFAWEGRRPYSNLERGGINDIIARGKVLGVEGSHGEAMSNRRDMIAYTLTNDHEGVIVFRLTADNSGPLFGIQPSGVKLHDWEVGWARFDGPGNWTDAWWTADELGFTLLVGGKKGSPESLNFWGEQQ
ncbi:MAG: ester cyclase [Acidiferrobacterales bacterium]|nr:ester cyclase [Acidiferrobacterales bacterium]